MTTPVVQELPRYVMMNRGSSNSDPYVIWPYFTGRDKGALRKPTPEGPGTHGALMGFFSQGHAWKYIFEVVQPNDDRACTNYRVVRLSEYVR